VAFSDSQPPSATAQLQYLGTFIDEVVKERDSAIKEMETAKRDLHKFQAASPAESVEKITNQQKKLDALQITAETAQQRLDALNKARVALRDQNPILTLIGELKNRLDEFPADGNESQKEQRTVIQAKIKKLETLDTVGDAASLWWIGVVALVLVFIALIMAFLHLWKDTSNSSKSDADDDGVARVRLAKLVTLGAIAFIFSVSGLTLLFAGIKAALTPGTEDMKLFFEIAKWILATVLPVVAAWVGGVMAYYFGKENFRAGAENAEKLVRELKQTPQQKLEALKASESGMEIDKAAVYRLPASVKLEKVKLTEIKKAFVKDGKTYERLPILDNEGCIQACLHMATLTKYTGGLTDADKDDEAKMMLGKLSWEPKQSFNTVSPMDNLIRVQTIINATKECKDVFVTADGTKSKRAERWITNDDITKITNI